MPVSGERQSLFENYIKALSNQEIKGILLKLKNELKRKGLWWEELKPLLRVLLEKDRQVFMDVIPLILE
jgi:CHAD domain-containing protein